MVIQSISVKAGGLLGRLSIYVHNRFMPPTYFHRIGTQMRQEIAIPNVPVCAIAPGKIDIFGDGLNGLGAGFKAPVMHQFIFEQSPKTFHGRCRSSFPCATSMAPCRTDRAISDHALALGVAHQVATKQIFVARQIEPTLISPTSHEDKYIRYRRANAARGTYFFTVKLIAPRSRFIGAAYR